LGADASVTEHFAYLASNGMAQSGGQLTVTVHGANDAPEAGLLLSGQEAESGVPFTYTLPTGSFYDVDDGDVLSYSATLDNGDPLPTWLTFDPATQTFTGTPGDDDAGNLQLTVTATDLAGASSSQNFTLDVTADDDPGDPETPIIVPDSAEIFEDSLALTGNVLSNDSNPGTVMSFQIDGNATVYNAGQTATIAGVGALTLNGNGDYSFTPVQDYSGLAPQVMYNTSSGSSATLDVTVLPVADTPDVVVTLGQPEHAPGDITTIDWTNAKTTDQGFKVEAFTNLRLDLDQTNAAEGKFVFDRSGLTPADTSIGIENAVQSFGSSAYSSVYRNSSGPGGNEISQSGTSQTPENWRSELIRVTFDQPVTSATVQFAWLNNTEHAQYAAYDVNGDVVASGTTIGESNAGNTMEEIQSTGDAMISAIEFFTPGPYGGGGERDDFLIGFIEYGYFDQ
jgi:hypothetical protein